jgi:hypothetical protein
VLRLSRGMTYKAAICELPYGGGKSVIIADPRRHKTPALLHAMGRIIEGFGGRYIAADDVGTTQLTASVLPTSRAACRSRPTISSGISSAAPALRPTTARWVRIANAHAKAYEARRARNRAAVASAASSSHPRGRQMSDREPSIKAQKLRQLPALYRAFAGRAANLASGEALPAQGGSSRRGSQPD